ncbi:MAG: trypsin-like peptidase domain-containing protein, partial [Oligoflexia bacterium]|nr:trypsin-like peptidase domain-containing protein [Oligoflexia bacterium]
KDKSTPYNRYKKSISKVENIKRVPLLPAPEGQLGVQGFAVGIQNGNERQQATAAKDIIKNLRPCVVTVISYQNEVLKPNGNNYIKLLDPYKDGNKSISSGIVIDPRGIVLTTMDAIPSNKIEVKLFRRKPNVFDAEILKVDNNLNLALLQIKGIGVGPTGEIVGAPTIYTCPLGDSTGMQIGDIVYAIGSPYGFADTVTSGIISSNRKKVRIEENIFRELIQTDATINKGNNGGPLVNIDGEVIGVNAAIYSENATFTGIGFAIPINNTKRFISNVISIKGPINGNGI